MKIKFLLLICATLIFNLATYSQNENQPTASKGFDKSNLFLGGNIGLQFGEVTFLQLSPQLGYKFSDYFAAGIGVNTLYLKRNVRSANDYSIIGKTTQSVLGANLFARAYPTSYFLIQLQPEINYLWGKQTTIPSSTYKISEVVPSLLVGAGVAIPLGGRTSLNAIVSYDLLQKLYSPYGRNPFYNAGFSFGF